MPVVLKPICNLSAMLQRCTYQYIIYIYKYNNILSCEKTLSTPSILTTTTMQPLSDAPKGASVIETLYEQCQRSIQSPIPRGYKRRCLKIGRATCQESVSRIKKRGEQLESVHECTYREVQSPNCCRSSSFPVQASRR